MVPQSDVASAPGRAPRVVSAPLISVVGRNAGVTVARGDVIVFIDLDAAQRATWHRHTRRRSSRRTGPPGAVFRELLMRISVPPDDARSWGRRG